MFPETKQATPIMELALHGRKAEVLLQCSYCGWEIAPGDKFTLVVQDTRVRFFCADDEQCAAQACK